MVNVQPEVIYSVNDVELGRGPIFKVLYPHRREYEYPGSIVYICPECGSAWGRLRVSPNFSGWSASRRRCPEHGPGLLLPPNLFGEYDFPKEVLRREIIRICENFHKPLSWYHAYLITGDQR